MPSYRYQARNAQGQSESGVVNADTANTAAAILRNQGLHVMGLTADTKAKERKPLFSFGQGKPGQKDILDFTTQLAVMIRAGINLRAALEGIADQTRNQQFQKVLISIKNDVESGKQFSEAIGKYPKLFGPLYVHMVQASEMSGSFSDMLRRIAGYISQSLETRKMVIGASIYPAIIGVMATSVTVFLLTFVLPKFYMVFEGKEDILPFATKFLMSLSNFMVSNWIAILAGVVALGVGLYMLIKTEAGSFWLDRIKLNMPLLKNMFNSLYISRSLQTMGQLINAGVPMLDTLIITGQISGNSLYKAMWKRVYNSVKQGRKIVQPLSRDKLLPRSVVQMISAGEESGKLGEVLDEISDYYSRQLKDQIKIVTGMIEPLMIVIMGSIVGFIAMAIILPIFKMSQIVS